MSDICFDDFDEDRRTCPKCGEDYDIFLDGSDCPHDEKQNNS